MAVHRIKEGSRTTYGSALRRFLDGRDVNMGLAAAVDDRLQQLARGPRGDSAARGLLSAIRMLEKLTSSQPPTCTGTGCKWKGYVEFLPQMQHPESLQRPPTWSTSVNLGTTGVGSACFSSPSVRWSTRCAPVTPKVSLGHAWGSGASWNFSMKRSTNNGSPTLSLLSLRQYVCAHRHPGTPDDSPVMPGGRNALRDVLKSCF